MAEVEKLVAQLSLDMRQFTREMQRAQGVSAKSAKAVESAWYNTNRKLNSYGASMARGIIAPLTGIAAAVSVAEVTAYADAWLGAKNSLAVAGVVGEKQIKVLDELYNSAQRNAAPITALADLFGKGAQAADNLGASQEDLLKFSDGVAVSLRVSGKSAKESSGALTQLGQLLGQARVQSEEFNSVNEGARPILIAVANGLDEAGGSVSKLKTLVNEGKVSGKQFFDAFLKGLPTIEKMAANSTQTVEQGLTKVNNAFTKYVGQADSSLGATARLTQGLNALADDFANIADTTLQVVSIIAAGLVGRALGGMIASLGLAGAKLARFIVALKAAKDVASVGVAIGGIGAAAGPVGALVGTVLVGALIAYNNVTGEATDGSAEYAAALNEIDESAKKAAIAVEDLKDKQAATKKAVDFGAREVEDVRAAVTGLFETLRSAPDSILDAGEKQGLNDLERQLNNNEKSAGDVKAELLKLAEANPAIESIVGEFGGLLDFLQKAIKATATLKGELAGLDSVSISEGNRAGAFAQQSARDAANKATNDFTSQRLADAKRSEDEKKLDARVKEIIADADKNGVAITESAARISAAMELAAEGVVASAAETAKAQAKSVEAAADLIKKNERFEPKPYNDPRTDKNGNQVGPNIYRAGYGSDTVQLSDGSVRKVTEGMTVTLKQATDDLSRRIAEFQEGIRGDIGGDVFASFSENQQAVLTDIAYNYGSLPDRIINAIATGDQGTISTAIRNLGADNGGINRRRRNENADQFLADSSAATQAGVTADENFAEKIKQQKEFIANLQAETGIRQNLNPLVSDYGLALTTLQVAQELLNAAQEEGVAAGLELKDVQQLLTGDLSTLTPAAREQALAMRELANATGTAKAESEKLEVTQKKTNETLKESSAFGKDVLGGFIRDLREGKSASEALAGALEKVADKLLDVALNSLFDGGGKGGGGGLGGIFRAIGKLLGFSSGTANTGGKRGEPRGIVHGQEAVIPLNAGGKIPIQLPPPVTSKGAGSNETITIMLNDDSGRMADIANTQIKSSAGTIIKVATQQSVGQVKNAFPGMLSDAQTRKM